MHPSWCAVDRCDAAQPGGVHRSAVFSLVTPQGKASAFLWQVPATADNPRPNTYVTLLDASAALSPVLAPQPDQRRTPRRARQRLAASLAQIPEQSRRAA